MAVTVKDLLEVGHLVSVPHDVNGRKKVLDLPADDR